MSETTLLNIFCAFFTILIVGVILVSYFNQKLLLKNGEKTQGLILGWRAVGIGGSYTDQVQSLSKPIVSFTTKKGEEIKGTPVTGFSDSPEPVNIYVTVYYDPENPALFVVKM